MLKQLCFLAITASSRLEIIGQSLRVFTMRFVGSVVLSLIYLGNPLCAQEVFDTSLLSRADARVLQFSLAYSGDYIGRSDGEWGNLSEIALLEATHHTKSISTTLKLVSDFLQEVYRNNWAQSNGEGSSIFLPFAILSMNEGVDWFELVTEDRSLVVRHIYRSRQETGAMQSWLESSHSGRDDEFYRASTTDAFISRGEIASGKKVYLRTNTNPGQFETVLVQWEPQHEARARVIIASLFSAPQPNFVVSESGYLYRLFARYENNHQKPRVEIGDEVVPDDPEKIDSSGTGFFVNSNTIVTSEHVISGCGKITFADGVELQVVASDARQDLAVLASEQRSAFWLTLGSGGLDNLGAPVFSVGFPFAGIFEQGISVTSGNISASRGLAGESYSLLFSAPVQPGNSGGPLLSKNGLVVGVVRAKASADYTRSLSGAAAENMNVATRLKPLRQFLQGAGVQVPSTVSQEYALDEGLPIQISNAVVKLVCEAPS